MTFGLTFWIIIVTLGLCAYILFAIIRELFKEHRERAAQKLRKLEIQQFYHIFNRYPDRLTHKAKQAIEFELRRQAQRIYELHQYWRQSVEEELPQLTQQRCEHFYRLAVRDFNRGLRLAIKFKCISRTYTSYHQFASKNYIPADTMDAGVVKLTYLMAN